MMLKIWTVNNDYHEYDLKFYALAYDDTWITLASKEHGVIIHPWATVSRLWHPDPHDMKAAGV